MQEKFPPALCQVKPNKSEDNQAENEWKPAWMHILSKWEQGHAENEGESGIVSPRKMKTIVIHNISNGKKKAEYRNRFSGTAYMLCLYARRIEKIEEADWKDKREEA